STDRLMQALSTLAALLDRTINEVKLVDDDFQKRLTQAIRETETSFQQDLKAEREKLSHELDKATTSATQWESEKRQLLADCAQTRKMLVEAKIAQEMAEKAATAALARAASGVKSEPVRKEIARVEELIKSVSAVIDDPTTELSTVIRKNVERAELESYLRGMRFALDG